jgi:hypothetical protein
MFQLIDRIKKTVALCFDPQAFADAADAATKETFKSVEAANKKLAKKTKQSINWNWKNLKNFVLTTCFAALSILGAARFAVLTTISSFTSIFMMTANATFAIASYLGALLITALLGWCLILVGVVHGTIIYPCIILPYQAGAFLVKQVRQIKLPTWKRQQRQAVQTTTVQVEETINEVPQLEVITNNNQVVLMMPSNLNDSRVWTEQKLVEFCDEINRHYPDSISNHHFPGIKRRTLVRKVRDFFNHQRKAEITTAAA